MEITNPAVGRAAAPAALTGFYAGLPVFDSFEHLTDPSIYTPLPAGWLIGTSDIVRSTAAIEAGRYKVVNTAAAAVIVAVANALKNNDFPFVFGGDGAGFALPPELHDLAAEALAEVATWVRDEFDLDLRVALVSIDTLRERGFDVQVARFAPSTHVSYAMFTGGGLAYAERQMKAGEFAVPPAPVGARPDLNGLSCRFEEIRAENGLILSLIAIPASPEVDLATFNAVVADILRLAERGHGGSRPIPEGGPSLAAPFKGYGIERKALQKPGLAGALGLAARRLVSYAIFALNRPVGNFDPTRYRQQLVDNTDFRKFDDGLRMTLDCTPALADALERRLAEAERKGIVRFGLHRQEAALMTCFVPSATRSDHIHFVDGAMGGYAMAARALKPQD
ncbi:DUF3095 domain-containing protein [Microvirga antarctica]|uniref:DUF3095 domain-containing protein n=1 Tax=Microvirga antarctica TaxID=2819233 RepID=UPI0031BAC29B